MKIKTAKKIYWNIKKEEDIWKNHQQTLNEFAMECDKKFIAVDDIVKELDKVWKNINTCKMDKVRPNFITKTQVAYYIGQLRKALTSNSSSDKSESFNKGYEVNQK